MADRLEERSGQRMGASEQESISIGSEKAPFSDARQGVGAMSSFVPNAAPSVHICLPF